MSFDSGIWMGPRAGAPPPGRSRWRSNSWATSAAEFGRGARVPVNWLVAAKDSYFSPDLSRQLADSFRIGGDSVEFRVPPASGGEGHWLAESEAGVKSAEAELDRALMPVPPAAARKAGQR